jgi:hypothetical protein
MAHPVVHFEVSGKDSTSLKSFYEQLFGWKAQDVGQGYWIAEKETEGIGGGIGQADDGSPGYVTFYVQTDDPQASLDKAESLGGKTVMPVTTVPDMVTFALFTDPEGNMVGLVASQTPQS